MRKEFKDIAGESPRELLRALDPLTLKPVKDGCWSIQHGQTGKTYYIKRTQPEEIAMTQKASQLQMPAESNLHMPTFISGDIADLPSDIQALIPVSDAKRTALLITQAHVLHFRMEHGEYYDLGHVSTAHKLDKTAIDAHGFPCFLRGQRISIAEFDQLEKDIIFMNHSGVFNFDLGSNLLMERTPDGTLHFFAIDFEPHAFRRGTHSNYDQETIQQLRADVLALGLAEGYERSPRFQAWQKILCYNWQKGQTRDGEIIRVALKDIPGHEAQNLLGLMNLVGLSPHPHESKKLGPTLRLNDPWHIESRQAHFGRLFPPSEALTAELDL